VASHIFSTDKLSILWYQSNPVSHKITRHYYQPVVLVAKVLLTTYTSTPMRSTGDILT